MFAIENFSDVFLVSYDVAAQKAAKRPYDHQMHIHGISCISGREVVRVQCQVAKQHRRQRAQNGSGIFNTVGEISTV